MSGAVMDTPVGELPDLANAGQLAGYPGAPFPPEQVKAAGAHIRALCGWHIAPVLTQTLILDSDGASELLVPSLYVRDVTAVRVVRPGASVATPATGWNQRTGWSRDGILYLSGGFPRGFRSVEVDLVHGYDVCPPDLLRLLAARTQRRVVAESLQGHAITFADGDAYGLDPLLDFYRIDPRP